MEKKILDTVMGLVHDRGHLFEKKNIITRYSRTRFVLLCPHQSQRASTAPMHWS